MTRRGANRSLRCPHPALVRPRLSLPSDLAGLRASQQFAEARIKYRSVKDELRENLICRLKTREPIFPDIVGFEDTVVPQIVNAVLSRQNFILSGAAGAGEEPYPARAYGDSR